MEIAYKTPLKENLSINEEYTINPLTLEDKDIDDRDTNKKNIYSLACSCGCGIKTAPIWAAGFCMFSPID